MAMQRIDLSDDSDDFETIIGSDGRRKKVLRDRHTYRVPMRMADAAHQPGFAAADASITDAKAEAAREYAAYDARLTSAWRDPPSLPPTGFGSGAFAGAQSQAAPQQPENDQRNQRADHAGTMDAAYADYETRLRDAWKSPS